MIEDNGLEKLSDYFQYMPELLKLNLSGIIY